MIRSIKPQIGFQLIIFFLGVGFCFDSGFAIKVPFRVNDVLPVLPRQISWPVLNNLHSAVDLMPSYVGSVTPQNNESIQWKGTCFFENSARLEFTENDDDKGGIGGGLLHLKVLFSNSFCFIIQFGMKIVQELCVLTIFLWVSLIIVS